MVKKYLPFHAKPSEPKLILPHGAVDAHCHVFGPSHRFPFAAERKYTPCDAPKEKLFRLRDFLGFERNVIVQASCHGRDNSAMLDALRAAGDLARGVAVVGPDISENELMEMHEAGVRAVRFNFVKRLVEDTPKAVFMEIAKKIAKFGWHIVVYFEAQDLVDIIPFLERLPTTIVIDHMGRPNVENGVEHTDFLKFIALMDKNKNIWTKVTCPERLSLIGPEYDDVVPFAEALVARFPDRVLWGTDWPHPNMKSHMPDDGLLVDFIQRIAPEIKQQRALLVDNPMRLYWEEGENNVISK